MKNRLQTKGKKLFKTLGLSMAFSGMIFSSANAQFDVQVGTGTGTTSNVPITSCWGYSYTQQIYTATDLAAVGITGPAEISKIRFFYSSGASGSSTGWTVYMGNSTKTSFTSNTDWEVIGNLSNVFSGTVSFPGSNDNWMEITLDTPFQWNGIDNLIVGVDENQSGWNCTIYWRKSDLGGNRSIHYRNDSNNPNPASPPTATGREGHVPNIQLVGTPTNPCSGTPVVADINSSEGLLLCENDDTELSISGLPFEGGLTYQWQVFDGSMWNDIVDETVNTYTTGSLTISEEYRVVIGCSNSGLSTPSNSALITVNPNPIVEVDMVSAAICPAGSETISATGASTYAWSPATGLNVTSGATVVANPANSTTYTVTGTDANGCIGTATSSITPIELIVSNIQVSPVDLCESGIPVLASVDALPAISGGAWSYRFLENNGITEAQTWSSSNEFNFIPSEDSLYTFYYQVQNSACGEPLDSIKFEFAVGFGADITIIDYDCNNLGGTINLTNIFGQVEVTEVFSNEFSGSDVSAFTFTGAAALTDGRAVITPSATGTSGSMMITVPNLALGPNNSMELNFDMTTDMPINNYGTGGADGITYSFGDDANSGANGNGVNGKGTKLRLSFDTAGNSLENNNQTGVYLVYGWTAGNAFGPGSAQTLAYNPNMSWKGGTDVPVNFTIDAEGKATLYVGGVLFFEDIQMPAAYMNADVSNWTQLFSAGTGGDAERHAVDNFELIGKGSKYALTQGSATDEPTTWESSSTFTNVQPGVYHVWMGKDETNTCLKLIETVEIINTDPVIELGNDTTICAGEILTLDAGYPGSTYLWSNSTETTQTIDVDAAGSYAVYLTAANGCSAIGSITVDVQDAPSATGISVQGNYPNVVFTVDNATATDTYDWDFGDGSPVMSGSGTIFHSYTSTTNFEYDVTATLSNDCGSVDVSENFVLGFLSINENAISGLTVYPNPATDVVTIAIENSTEASLVVYSMAGSVIDQLDSFNGQVKLNVSNWEKGVYFIQIMNEGKSVTQKIVVQ